MPLDEDEWNTETKLSEKEKKLKRLVLSYLIKEFPDAFTHTEIAEGLDQFDHQSVDGIFDAISTTINRNITLRKYREVLAQLEATNKVESKIIYEDDNQRTYYRLTPDFYDWVADGGYEELLKKWD